MIEEGAEDRQILRVFIGALTDKALLLDKPQAMAVAFHASMFGKIAQSFK
jgi:hypothetical protein